MEVVNLKRKNSFTIFNLMVLFCSNHILAPQNKMARWKEDTELFVKWV
ncbi:hypothetical protein SLEP1_g52199 [Rubroshorea leprosula]|uniref:Uncharacterized protein n=1 Tax=Rubroshorea leprosula TaxID=152421 RepID=A0AAV5M5Q3_9ROSI|nr:hypothetical protein SLEP1_g52199 [Rubroshorea leprosula]